MPGGPNCESPGPLPSRPLGMSQRFVRALSAQSDRGLTELWPCPHTCNQAPSGLPPRHGQSRSSCCSTQTSISLGRACRDLVSRDGHAFDRHGGFVKVSHRQQACGRVGIFKITVSKQRRRGASRLPCRFPDSSPYGYVTNAATSRRTCHLLLDLLSSRRGLAAVLSLSFLSELFFSSLNAPSLSISRT